MAEESVDSTFEMGRISQIIGNTGEYLLVVNQMMGKDPHLGRVIMNGNVRHVHYAEALALYQACEKECAEGKCAQ